METELHLLAVSPDRETPVQVSSQGTKSFITRAPTVSGLGTSAPPEQLHSTHQHAVKAWWQAIRSLSCR